jgi:cell wall-associated NlpC family hydrolase
VALTRTFARARSACASYAGPRHGVGAAAIAATIACVLIAPTAAGATPAPTTPTTSTSSASAPATITSVTAKLASLSQQNEMVTEAVNLAQADLVAKQAAAASAQQKAAAQVAAFRAARDQFGQTVAAQYESDTFSAAGALFTSDSGQNYLDKVSTMSLLTQHRTAQVVALSAAKAAADQAQKTSAALLAAAVAKQQAVTKQKAGVEADTKKFKALLASLTVAQQQAYHARNVPAAAIVAQITAVPVHAGNTAAQKAVDFATAQLGKPYVTNAAGPNVFDCSGLTMRAWQAAGVSLPHNAAAQYGYGTHVSMADLQPGDLIFLYRPIGHVEIYVGNNLAISAPETGDHVKYVDIRRFGNDYTGATRLT